MRKTLMLCSALLGVCLLLGAAPQPAAPSKPVPVMATPAAAPMAPAALPAMAPAPVNVSVKAAPPTVKPAAKQDSTGSVVGGLLLQILITFMTIALPIVLTPLVLWLLKKMKVEKLQTQQMIDGIIDQAIVHGLNYANEQAHKLRDNPVKGAEKLNLAADKALAYLKDSGIVGKGAEYIKDLIEAKLGETREAEKPGVATSATEDKAGSA